ncbi:hypothetical protein L209DRAFT_260511 [Thermothelomyces heterothallicus CBS 203.75]
MNSCIDRAGYVICICGGFVHQNRFIVSKSWAAPHDTSLISIDVTHQRNGQGKGRHCCRSAFHYPGVRDGELIDFFSLLHSLCPCLYTSQVHALHVAAAPHETVDGWDGDAKGRWAAHFSNEFMFYDLCIFSFFIEAIPLVVLRTRAANGPSVAAVPATSHLPF